MAIDDEFSTPEILYIGPKVLGYREIIYRDSRGYHNRLEASGTWVAYEKPRLEHDHIIDEKKAMELLAVYDLHNMR